MDPRREAPLSRGSYFPGFLDPRREAPLSRGSYFPGFLDPRREAPLSRGSYFPGFLDPRRMAEKALTQWCRRCTFCWPTKLHFVIAITVPAAPRRQIRTVVALDALSKGKSMDMMRTGLIAALGFALMTLPITAMAGEFNPSSQLRSACKGDVLLLCSTSLFSWDSLVVCLRAKKSQVSEGCRAQYAAESKVVAQKCNSACNYDPLKWEVSVK